MLEDEIRLATCRIECGKDSGSGWLIAPDKIITAFHCIVDAVNGNASISVFFDSHLSGTSLIATIIDHDDALDVCLLGLEQELDINPLIIKSEKPLNGIPFHSWGWPATKLTLGHRIDGHIAQVLSSPKLGIDIEIHPSQETSLSKYDGMSGAALICEGVCVGVFCVSVDKTIGAISLAHIEAFLKKNDLLTTNSNSKKNNESSLVARENFTDIFDSFISQRDGNYVFLEGAHGIGKSTFCINYQPQQPVLEHFSTYSFSSGSNNINAVQMAQPLEFVNWLNVQVSKLISGVSCRVIQEDYAKLIGKTEELLNRAGTIFKSRGKIGVLFIDGIDEIAKHSKETIAAFSGLLPKAISSGIVVVISAPGHGQFIGTFSHWLNQNACVTMPALSLYESRELCHRTLISERNSSMTIQIICERAGGHPLYLRYLIDLANTGTDDINLAALPLIEGSIRNYYDALWAGLQSDAEVVNLLSIIARLRWGIPISLFTEILNQAERSVLITTLNRLQHLLQSPENTAIYHASFTEFLQEKTSLLECTIQTRLSEYCQHNQNNRYGLINLIHHGLRANDSRTLLTVNLCNQNWVDNCVSVGANPDLILSDIRQALEAATKTGSLTETVRLLLLSQRLYFRYDTLLAQSAYQSALALIALGKNQEALQHVVRYDQLLLSFNEALAMAISLNDSGDESAAFRLLELVEVRLDDESLSEGDDISFGDFLSSFSCRAQLYRLKMMMGDNNARHQSLANEKFYFHSAESGVSDEEKLKFLKSEMMVYNHATIMALQQQYVSITHLSKFYRGPIEDFAEPLVKTIVEYKHLCDDFDLLISTQLLQNAFNDLKILLAKNWTPTTPVHPMLVDLLITLGAPAVIISALTKEICPTPSKITYVAEDGVSFDIELFKLSMADWKRKAFLDPAFMSPPAISLSENNWKLSIEAICQTVAWAEGAAQRCLEKDDTAGLDFVWKVVARDVFPNLKFRLKARSKWQNAYALPEAFLPRLYELLAKLMIGYFPSQLTNFIELIEEQFDNQCGIYSEGFRGILTQVIDTVSLHKLEAETEDRIFTLTQRWRNYVVYNLKNRAELIPELLTIVPFFVRLQASEEAKYTYQCVLAHSMGPGWYKEDQFSLLITALLSLGNETTPISGFLAQTAALLDAASGEMTFQRFVRYAKKDFIKALSLRGDFSHAVEYYIVQTYGTLEQIYEDATDGEMDRLSQFEGSRYPGNALDEQDAVLEIIMLAIPEANWSICWALLETFQFGDNRHLKDYAKAYAIIMNKMQGDSQALEEMFNRIGLICESDVIGTSRSEFLSTISSTLGLELNQSFNAMFGPILAPNKPDTFPETPSSSITQNDILLPGTFGAHQSISTAHESLANAERQLRRSNTIAACKSALEGLRQLQDGGWSLWTNSTEEISGAKSLLLKASNSVADIIKGMSSLIVDGRYSEKWRIADTLIEWLAFSSELQSKSELAAVTIDHIRNMVGDVDNYLPRYHFLEERNNDSLSSSLIKLLLHAVNHPSWLRAEKAAEMLMWLMDTKEEYIPVLGPEAFTMKADLHPDIIAGALDILSNTDSMKIWNLINPSLDFSKICKNCQHAGRYAILTRIIKRASDEGAQDATAKLHQLEMENLATSFHQGSLIPKSMPCPTWAKCIELEWEWMVENAFMTEEVLLKAQSYLENYCAPLSLEDSLTLEKLLAVGYRANNLYPERWRARLRMAFQNALFLSNPQQQLNEIGQAFCVYNPSEIASLRIIGFESPTAKWIDILKSEAQTSELAPIIDDLILLDFYEHVWMDGSYVRLRVTAYLVDGDNIPQLTSGHFLSTELPDPDNSSKHDVSTRVIVRNAYFGSFTPALPSTHFIKLTQAPLAEFHRACWRTGRTPLSMGGAPEREGCYLAIHEDALILPTGLQLIWVYNLNGRNILALSH